MQFSARVINSQNHNMVNICDPELLGKIIVDGDLTINISKITMVKKLSMSHKQKDFWKIVLLLIW